MRQRTVWIDVLKGIAIILVVVGHNANQSVFDMIQCFHMPLFFMLSGFLFSPKPIRNYFNKSVNRLLIPYVSFLLLISIPEVLSLAIHNDIGGGKKLLFRMIYGGYYLQGAYGVFWFITVLWMATNLFNVILYRKYSIWLLTALIAIGYFAELLPTPLPWNIHVVPMAVSYIWIGFLINKSVQVGLQEMRSPSLIAYFMIAVLIMTGIYIFRHELTLNMKYNDYGLPLLSLVCSVISSISVAVFAILIAKIGLVAKILSFIGDASMVIMFLHQAIKFIFLTRLGLEENYVIVILSGILLSLAVYVLMKQSNLARKYLLGEAR